MRPIDDRLRPTSVLFLYTANSARSRMAGGLLRSLGPGRFAVASAGTAPATELYPLAVPAVRAAGGPEERAWVVRRVSDDIEPRVSLFASRQRHQQLGAALPGDLT